MVGQSATPLFMHESVKKSGVKEDEPQPNGQQRHCLCIIQQKRVALEKTNHSRTVSNATVYAAFSKKEWR